MNKRTSMLIGTAVIMAFLQVCPTHFYAEQDVDYILSSNGEEIIEESISEADPFEGGVLTMFGGIV